MAVPTHLTLTIAEVYSKMPTTKTFSSIDECLDEVRGYAEEILQKKAQQNLTIEECSCCPLDVKAVKRRIQENGDGRFSCLEDYLDEFKVTALTMCIEEKQKLLKLETEKWKTGVESRKEQAEKDGKEQVEKDKKEGKEKKKSNRFISWAKNIVAKICG